MNDTKNSAAQTCIDGLKEIILNVLAEAKEKGEHLGATDIAKKTGIREQFDNDESRGWVPSFTRTLLLDLQHEDRVKQHGKGKGSFWEMTDEDLNKRI